MKTKKTVLTAKKKILLVRGTLNPDRYHSGYERTNSQEAIAPPTTLYKVLL